MKKIILLCLILIVSSLGFSQAQKDSLLQKLPQVSGKAKAKVLLSLSNLHLYKNPTVSLDYSSQALKICRKNGLITEECKAVKNMGIAYANLREYKKSYQMLNTGLDKAKKHKLNKLMPEFYFYIGNNYFDKGDFNGALQQYQTAKKLWEKNESKRDIAGISKQIGSIYWSLKKYNIAKDYFEYSLKIYKEIKDLKNTASVLNNIGHVYYITSDYKNALNLYLKSLKIRENLGDKEKTASTLYSIGTFYIIQKNNLKAMEYLKRAAKIFEEKNNNKMLLNTYNSLGVAYKTEGKLKTALDYYQKVIDIGKKTDYSTTQKSALNNIAIIYQELNEPDKALQYYKKALKTATGKLNANSRATYFHNIGSLYLQKNDYNNARKYLIKAYDTVNKANDKTLLSKIYKNLSDTYSKQKKYKTALKYHKKYVSIKDSLNSVELKKAIAELQTKYDTEKKEKKIELLKRNAEIQKLKLAKQKNRLILIALISVITIGFSILIYKTKQKQIRIQKQVESEIKKMNKQLKLRVKEELAKQVKQREKLIQKSKLESIGKLAAGIAHEINQPLGGISMGLENIYFAHTEGRLSDKYLEEKLQQIDGYFDRIKQIIDHIRIFSRDQKSVLFEDIDVNKAVKDALSLLQTQYENHNVQLKIDLSASLPTVRGNKFKLEQVILNLLTNAKDAVDYKHQTTEKFYQKKIIIKTYTEKNKLILEIKDNGNGISQENIKNIFDPFFTTKEPSKGTGLGLSITYGIIKEMNGDISVESIEKEYTKMKVEFVV